MSAPEGFGVTALKFTQEFARGCSCARMSTPWECTSCTQAFAKAMHKLLHTQKPEPSKLDKALTELDRQWAL